MAVYLIAYGISYLLARQHVYVLSGLVLITAALWLYIQDYRRSGDWIDLQGLFSLAFAGGQGAACMKLSRLQTDWADMTWLCFLMAVVSFRAAYGMAARRGRPEKGSGPGGFPKRPAGLGAGLKDSLLGRPAPAKERAVPALSISQRQGRRLLQAMAGITGVSAAAFLFEAWKLGFIPMFSYGVPHAYSAFHVTGVHYFTVSCVLVPSLFVVYLSGAFREGKTGRGRLLLGAGLTAVSLTIPLMCVSRFQLILAVGMAAFTFISVRRTFRLRYVLLLACLMVPAYLGLTVLRSHSVAYLNGIFEMKDSRMPIFITQPYMYIANNYDNFNCMVEQLGEHTLGLRMLFPLWALTGLKFLAPALVDFPLFVTKEELTTLTLVYDAYYDFGLLGIVLFGALLGFACARLTRLRDGLSNPVIHVVYAQIAMYMALAFFTTWFSNPSTWFYLGLTGAALVFVGSGEKGKGPHGEDVPVDFVKKC